MSYGLTPNQLEQLFDQWPEPLLSVNDQGQPMGANRALLELFRDADGVLPNGLGELDPDALQALLQADEWLSVRTAEGRERHFRLLDLPAGACRLRCLRDVTREHEARSELEHQQGASDAALKDPLTGLRNRRALSLALAPLVSMARRYARPLSAVAVEVSDGNGLALDDAARLATSQTLCDQTRWADVIALYDERRFVVVVPETDGEAAQRFAHKLRQALSAENRQVRVGLAECRKSDDADRLVERAVENLTPGRSQQHCA